MQILDEVVSGFTKAALYSVVIKRLREKRFLIE